jgi:hypothetical protein
VKKEEMAQEIQAQLSTLKDHADSLNQVCDGLQQMLRNGGGDVAFTTVENTKKLIDEINVPELKAALEKTFKTLKARAVARVKEI